LEKWLLYPLGLSDNAKSPSSKEEATTLNWGQWEMKNMRLIKRNASSEDLRFFHRSINFFFHRSIKFQFLCHSLVLGQCTRTFATKTGQARLSRKHFKSWCIAILSLRNLPHSVSFSPQKQLPFLLSNSLLYKMSSISAHVDASLSTQELGIGIDTHTGAFTIVGTDLTSYEPTTPTSDSRALVKYIHSPFTELFDALRRIDSASAKTSILGSTEKALIHSNSKDFRALLDRAFPNPYLRVLIAYIFRDSILSKPLKDDQMMFVTNQEGGNSGVFFKPAVADQILGDFRRLAAMVVMAANGIDNPENPLLPHYPRDVVNLEWSCSELPNPFPHLSLIFSSDNFIAKTHAYSRSELREMYAILQFVGRQYALWIGDQVARSVQKGYLSECSWGTFFGIPQDEFMTLLTRKSVERLEAEKELMRRRKARFTMEQNKKRSSMGVTKEEMDSRIMVIHPTESAIAKGGLLVPYDPKSPGWTKDVYYPSPEVTADEEDWEEVMKMVLENRKLE
jgi:hypothetical protein